MISIGAKLLLALSLTTQASFTPMTPPNLKEHLVTVSTKTFAELTIQNPTSRPMLVTIQVAKLADKLLKIKTPTVTLKTKGTAKVRFAAKPGKYAGKSFHLEYQYKVDTHVGNCDYDQSPP